MVNLLKRVIFRDKDSGLWQGLVELHAQVNDQASILGLECIVDDVEGYAYLKQQDLSDVELQLPRLVQRRQLSYHVSLLCVLLRKKLLESDAGGESTRVVLPRDHIIEMMSLFMPDMGNEVKMIDRIESALRKIIEMGFVRVLDDERGIFEIQRILKAFVDADWIASLDEKLAAYREYINEQ